MEIIRKNKRGFTLLEMVLSLAIITIVSGCLYTLIVSIKDSYVNTYNSDDSADYAMLYARAIENSFLANTQSTPGSPATSGTWTIQSGFDIGGGDLRDSILTFNNVPVFVPSQNKVNTRTSHVTKDKWRISMAFYKDGDVIRYRIVVVDNYYEPGTIKAVYESILYVPHLKSVKLKTGGSNVMTSQGYNTGHGWFTQLIFDKTAT